MTGFQATRVTKPRPYFDSARRDPSTSFQTMRPTRTVAPSAAAPATSCSTTSPKRTRRPVKGRRVGVAETSAADTRAYLWILAIAFSATTSTDFGSGTKRSFAVYGPVWPFVTAQKRKCLRSVALADCSGTITYVNVEIGYALSYFFGGFTIDS